MRSLPMASTKRRQFHTLALSIVPMLLYKSSVATAWMAEWIKVETSSTTGTSLTPPRSGHVSFVLNNDIFVFGGYAEEGPVRYPINDLWKYDQNHEWTCVHPPHLWPPTETTLTTTTTSQKQRHTIPQQRLAAAAASLPGMAFVLGGWDSQQPGTGGTILNDIACITQQQQSDSTGIASTSVQWSWDDQINLGLPTSRLVALPISNSTILIHNHRCTDSVILLTVTTNSDTTTDSTPTTTDPDHSNKNDSISWHVTTQPTTGIAPSPRGLHAATFVPPNRVVVFGGAAQTGEMLNEVFILDTQTWQWSQLQIPLNDSQPSPRASPCFCTLDNSNNASTTSPPTCLLFGGADRTKAAQGIPLHGCDDLWILHLDPPRWEPLIPSTTVHPPGRNAATLTPLHHATTTTTHYDDDGSQSFLLVGGWYPFQTTHSETYILTMRPSN